VVGYHGADRAGGAFFALLIVCYFYYRSRLVNWPPVDPPGYLIGGFNLALIVATCYPMWIIQRRAPDASPSWLARMLAFAAVLQGTTALLRIFEFRELHTHYDQSAYGSITWAFLFTHGLELLLTLAETALLAVFSATNELDTKHRGDIQMGSMFYYFLAITWVVMFTVMHVGARAL
jgi:heme/copper-type cytochrome/quinol oxidase subunit 3